MSYSIERPVQLGLCCMNVTLKKQKPPVYAARRIIVRMIDKLGIEELKRRILQNLDDLYKMLQWNESKGIRVFRLSSEMFQHKNNKRVQDYTYDFAIPMLQKIGAYARENGHRLTFHPGQFNNLGSNRECVIQQTLLDLEYHADVLDLMGMGSDSVMVIHGGGTYGDKPGTMKRWIANYNKLPDKIKRRLVLENCEKCYSIRDCLKMSFKCGVPVVLDTHHFECYKKLHPDEAFKPPEVYIPFILNTWSNKGIKPKFHVSEQGSGKLGHHSDYINILPTYLLEIPTKYGVHIDIMIEAKMKELSIQKLYEKYPECNCLKENEYYISRDIMNRLVDSIEQASVTTPTVTTPTETTPTETTQTVCDIQNADGLTYLSTITNNSVDLILTDPPYITSTETGMGNLHKQIQSNKAQGIDYVKTEEEWESVKDKYIGKKDMNEETMKHNYMKYGSIYGSKYSVQTEYGEWDTSFSMEQLDTFIGEYYKKLRKGGTIILFFDIWKITPLKELLEKHNFKQIRFIEWIKTNPQPLNSKTNYLTNCREIALLGVKGGKPTFHSKYDRAIYEFPIQGGAKRIHPTQKPRLLFEELIKKHSNEGDVVLDTFLGSGTTAIACKNTNRIFKGCEISKEYYDKLMEIV